MSSADKGLAWAVIKQHGSHEVLELRIETQCLVHFKIFFCHVCIDLSLIVSPSENLWALSSHALWNWQAASLLGS